MEFAWRRAGRRSAAIAAVLLRAGCRECAGMDGVGARLLRRGRRARRGQSRACKINRKMCGRNRSRFALLVLYIANGGEYVKFTFYM